MNNDSKTTATIVAVFFVVAVALWAAAAVLAPAAIIKLCWFYLMA